MGAFVRSIGVARALAVFAGFAYPIDFLLHLDAYRVHLSGGEIVRLYAWGFWVEIAIALVALSLLALAGAALGGRRPGRRTRLVARLVALLALLVVASTLAGSEFAWLRTQAWWQALRPGALAKILLAVASAGLAIAVIAFEGPRQRILSLARALGIASASIGVVGAALIASDGRETGVARAMGPAAKAPVILVSIDALSADHLSSYGYGRATSPQIDCFADTATRYDRFYSVSNWTSPGTNALINGVRPWDSELLVHHARAPRAIAEQGLPATLRRAGYATYMVVTNRYASPYIHHTEADWDAIRYDETWSWGPHSYWATFEENFLPLKQLRQAYDRLSVAIGLQGEAEQFAPERAFALARKLIEHRDPAHPFFLWVHILPPHDPYAAPAPYGGMFNRSTEARTMFDSLATYHAVPAALQARQALLRDRYDESVRYSDAGVGKFLDWLRMQGLFDESLIALTSDHGESFSHDYGGHGGPGLHDELIHVPLIIKKPYQSVGGVSHDVMDQSALANLLRGDLGLSIQAPAQSMAAPWPVQAWSMNFERSAAPAHRFDQGSIAVVSWPWKYITYRGAPEPGQRSVSEELFDLSTDPSELHNRLAESPEVAAALRSTVQSQIQAHLQQRR